jgi:ATP synthase protein I
VLSQPPEGRKDAGLGAAGTALGLGCSIVVSIILCVGGGLVLDSWTGKSPLFTLLGVALGMAAAGYQLYELTTIGRTDRSSGPLARQIERVQHRRGGHESDEPRP